jgi:uncharacterized protein (TIGR00255 family)
MTINSMTAFARESDESGPGGLAIEIRSVNHRYLDSLFKLPEQLRALEPVWRQRLQAELSRGKVEIQVRWQSHANQAGELHIDAERLAQLAQALADVSAAVATSPPSALDLLQWPGVIEAGADEEGEHNQRANRLFEKALKSLLETRAREGAKLAQLIRGRLTQVGVQVEAARTRMPELLAQQRQRLETRLSELDLDIDPGRLEQELVMLAQKADVEEEFDRLCAHVEEVSRVLEKGGPCGRRLDFLMQELNREANTLSSKSIATSTTQNAVELKVLIEQMREQIQNLE